MRRSHCLDEGRRVPSVTGHVTPRLVTVLSLPPLKIRPRLEIDDTFAAFEGYCRCCLKC